MFLKQSFAAEIAQGFEKNLTEGEFQKNAAAQNKLVKIAEHLNQVAELCDDLGLGLESEVATTLLENITIDKAAAKKKKKKKPSINEILKKDIKDKKKKTMKTMKDVEEENGGPLFKMKPDRFAADDADHNCAFCGGYGNTDTNHAMDFVDEDDFSPESDRFESNSDLVGILHELRRKNDTEPMLPLSSDDDFEDEWEPTDGNSELDMDI